MSYLPLKTVPDFYVVSTDAHEAQDTPDQNNWAYRGLILDIDITGTFTGTSVTFTIQGKDPGSGGAYYTILASAAKTGIGHTTMYVHPDIAAVANIAAASLLPARWRVAITESSLTVVTYNLSYTLVP